MGILGTEWALFQLLHLLVYRDVLLAVKKTLKVIRPAIFKHKMISLLNVYTVVA